MAQDRRVTKTKRAIKDALVELIMKKDSLKITITEIAQQADIDRKTFYLHYNSIDDVIHDASHERLDEFSAAINDQRIDKSNFNVSLIFETLNTLIKDDIDLYRHIAKNPGFSTFWNEAKLILEESMLRSLKQEFNLSNKSLEVYAEYFASGLTSTYLKWLRGDLAVSEDELGELVGNVSYYGLQKLLSQ